MKKIIALSAILVLSLSSAAYAADNAPEHQKKPPVAEQHQGKKSDSHGEQRHDGKERRDGKERPRDEHAKKHDDKGRQHNGDKPKHNAKAQDKHPQRDRDGKTPRNDDKKRFLQTKDKR